MKYSKVLSFTFLISLIAMLAMTACRKDNEAEPSIVFDRAQMLVHMADHVIIPRYAFAVDKTEDLVQATENFIAESNTESLQLLQNAAYQANAAYNAVALFEFGPAEDVMLRNRTNIFPSDTAQINQNIIAGNIDLTTTEQLDARGFPAIDFLIHGSNQSTGEMVSKFIDQPERGAYLAQVVGLIHNDLVFIRDQWLNGYRAIFIASNGTDIASSTGYLVNQINMELDMLKNAKIAIPLGLQTLNITQPQKTESYYGKHSLDLAIASLASIENVYMGYDTSASNGLGFDDYLLTIQSNTDGVALHAQIRSRFDQARQKLSNINAPIDAAVNDNTSAVDEAYTALVQLLVLLKTDMPSQLGVIINYQDGDGD